MERGIAPRFSADGQVALLRVESGFQSRFMNVGDITATLIDFC